MHATMRAVLLAALAIGLVGCHKLEVRAQCTVRSVGSYCTFQNTGAQAGRACFEVSVRPRGRVAVFARARTCSPVLQPGEESPPVVVTFDGENPYEQCVVDPASGEPRNCVTVVTTERVEAN